MWLVSSAIKKNRVYFRTLPSRLPRYVLNSASSSVGCSVIYKRNVVEVYLPRKSESLFGQDWDARRFRGNVWVLGNILILRRRKIFEPRPYTNYQLL